MEKNESLLEGIKKPSDIKKLSDNELQILADEIRNKIAELGYIVEETRQGTKISKK